MPMMPVASLSVPLVRILLCLLLVNSATSRGRRAFLAPSRGGGALDFYAPPGEKIKDNAIQSTVGVIVVGESNNEKNDNDAHLMDHEWWSGCTSATCIMLDGNEEAMSRMDDLPKDTAMTRSLAFLCDAVVLVIPPNSVNGTDFASLATSLVEGTKKRLDAPGFGNRGRLIIVASFSENEDEPDMEEELILRHFADIVPSEFSTFDIISKSKLEQLIKEILGGQNGQIMDLFPADEDNKTLFTRLLQQVYQIQGGKLVSNFEIHDLTGAEMSSTYTRNVPQVKTNKSLEGQNQESRMQEILVNCQAQLEMMESKLQDVLLSDYEKQIPLLDFGTMSGLLLNQTLAELQGMPSSFRSELMTPVVSELHRLYKDHLQTLRDYYGRRYEKVLAESKDEGEWASSAEHFMQGFQAAAINSVPYLCKPNEALADWTNLFDSTSSLQGLISDMLEATQIRKDEQSLAFEGGESDEDSSPRGRFHQMPRWLKKIAGRALMLGVNYIQGWLVWQGVKRAAIERDRSMPKFPLF